jgi:hypothetical protein
VVTSLFARNRIAELLEAFGYIALGIVFTIGLAAMTGDF